MDWAGPGKPQAVDRNEGFFVYTSEILTWKPTNDALEKVSLLKYVEI